MSVRMKAEINSLQVTFSHTEVKEVIFVKMKIYKNKHKNKIKISIFSKMIRYYV